jgi:SAM-dependent methyltransferase
MWTQLELDQYVWFHYMEFENGTYTDGWKNNKDLFDWILLSLNKFNLTNSKVIDVGCRYGLLTFKMENLGAEEIVAVDNDVSKGATELLIPRLKSKINMYECNLYDLKYKNYFDYTFCYGVLYHLRYPFIGLKRLVDITKVGGRIVLETAIVLNEILYTWGSLALNL